MGWLFLALVLAVFAGLFYVIRERRAQQLDEEHAREAAFLMDMRGSTGDGGAPAADWVRQTPAPHAEAPAAPLVPEGQGRPYLDRRHALVFRWLRTSLPDHEVLPRASLRRVVGRERVEKDMMLDFALCNPALEVVAVVDLDLGEHATAAFDFKREALEAVGVKYARWNPERLPGREALLAWISA